MTDIMREANALHDYMTAVRREIHAFPELGNAEFNTAKIIERELDAIGIAHCRLTETAVMGIIDGGHAGDTIAFRADMDALPIDEQLETPWRSKNQGIMHACGHDVHVAGLLGAARIIFSRRAKLNGCVKLFFQPDEEGSGGAQRMIQAGCMNNPDVKAVYGAHCAPELPCGTIGIKYGSCYAASNPIIITVYGKGAHGAEPQNGRDAIYIASEIVTSLQSIIGRDISPTDPAVITIGSFHSGTAPNIISDKAVLSGIIRCYGSEMRRFITNRVRELVCGLAAAMGGHAEVEIIDGYSGVVNAADCADRVRDAALSLIGEDSLIIEQKPTLTTEDFGAFIEAATGCFYHIGTGKDNNAAPLHSAYFDPDERALDLLAACHAGDRSVGV